MPAFDVNPVDTSKNRRPFVHMESAGDVTKQPAIESYAEQGFVPNQKLKNLGATLFRALKDAGLSTKQSQSWMAKNKIGKKSR